MRLYFLLNTSTTSAYEKVITSNSYSWGIEFDDNSLKEYELIKYFLNMLQYEYPYDERVSACIEFAKQLGMLDKIKPIILLSKYNRLIDANF